jgi:hypothetical protein
MTYTPTEVLVILGGVGGLVTTLGAAIVNIVVALRTNKKLDANTAMTQVVSAKADVITDHVNGAASSAAAKIEALQQENQLLRAQIADHKETAALLAQAVVQAPAPILREAHRATDVVTSPGDPEPEIPS